MKSNPHNEGLGSHVGRAIAEHLADVIVNVRSRLTPVEHSHRIEANNAWMEEAEQKFQPFVKSILAAVPDDADAPEWVTMLKATADSPKNQTDFLIYLAGIVGAVFALLPALGQVEIQKTLNKAWSNQPFRPLSPDALASAVEKGVISKESSFTEAAQSGIGQANQEILNELAGEPPGLLDMVGLFMRGDLPAGELNRMIAYSRVKTEWSQAVIDSYSRTMTQADAIEGAVKGVLSQGEAESLFIQAGGLAKQFGPLLDMAGNAIGVQQANSLYLHGLISHADLQKVILHSRINPTFEPMAELLRFHYLSVYQIHQALKSGAATAAEATKWLTEEGYPADQIAAFTHDGATQKVQAHKNVSEAQALALFEAHEINAQELSTLLLALGYTADEVTPIIETYEARKIIAAQVQAVTAVRKAFLGNRATLAETRNKLDTLGVSSNARDYYLADWQLEKGAQFRNLTEAQIASLAKKGFITYADARARWEAMGYTADDAGHLALLAGWDGQAP